jgi:DNA-binding NarL/FixJ family response regulator
VGEAPNGRLVIDVRRSTYPDVVLMDVGMPEMDGPEAARRLLDPPPGVVHRPKVIILATFDCDDYVYETLQTGVSGFLLKDAPIAELVQAVRVIAAGGALLAPSVTRGLIEGVSRRRPALSRNARLRLNGLTPREREALLLVAQGLSNTEIAVRLVVAEQTVKTHMIQLKRGPPPTPGTMKAGTRAHRAETTDFKFNDFPTNDGWRRRLPAKMRRSLAGRIAVTAFCRSHRHGSHPSFRSRLDTLLPSL